MSEEREGFPYLLALLGVAIGVGAVLLVVWLS